MRVLHLQPFPQWWTSDGYTSGTVSARTVEGHRYRIVTKLGIDDRDEIAHLRRDRATSGDTAERSRRSGRADSPNATTEERQ